MTTIDPADDHTPAALVPAPRHYDRHDGCLVLDGSTAIGADQESYDAAWLLHDALRGAGLRPPVLPAGDPRAGIRLGQQRSLCENPEGYRIVVSQDSADLVGATGEGLARAVQTFRQLLPPHTLRAANVTGRPVRVGCCRIDDEPRFRWRGVHLDVARHFMPKHIVMRLIDLAALHRLNILHLHLTDDQGWRLEVPSRPRLVEVASWRTETVVEAGGVVEYDGTPHGGYYTLDDLREIVAYAAQRHITVVPEVDLPGHVQAALAAYPELGVTGNPVPVRREWGISEHVLAPTKEALLFAREVLDVVLDVFPGRWVHLGGDECPRTQWRQSAAAADRAAELGLASVDELQSWFLRQCSDHLAGFGRQVVGWDEVLEDGGMPPDTVIMAWRNTQRGVAALQAGHEVVMAPQTVTYLDHYQSSDPDEPIALGGLSRLEDVAAWEPVPAGAGTLPGQVLGVQGQLWTERLPTAEAVEYMAFPRLSALAEVGWADRTRRDAPDLLRRIRSHLRRLDALGVGYRPVDGPLPHQRGGTGRRRRPTGHGTAPLG